MRKKAVVAYLNSHYFYVRTEECCGIWKGYVVKHNYETRKMVCSQTQLCHNMCI